MPDSKLPVSQTTSSPPAAARFPLVMDLPASVSAEQAFLRLCSQPYCVFLDSSLRDPVLGRYSFVTCDPYEVICDMDGARALATVRGKLAAITSAARADLPPFQGGAAGVLTYELGRSFESLPCPAHDEFALPPVTLGLYDVVVAFDHLKEQAFVISQGFPESDPGQRWNRAQARAKKFLALLEQPTPQIPSSPPQPALEISAPLRPLTERPELYSNFSAAEYFQAVARTIEYVRAGDVFQVNLAQRLLRRANDHTARLYLRLRTRTPATFAGYFDAGDWQVASASPERYLQVRAGNVESRPIKGTRRQTQQPIADLYAAADLRASRKDRAENVMIVDLIRNDLSRVCTAESVHVPQLCELESYGYVQHLVSAVRGRLRVGQDVFALLAASFPGGSITGAPKVRAMEIITELEQVARGPYCGSMGYVGWNGDLDLSILIRTVTAKGGWWQLPVGGGIVADSRPSAEYEETWHKAAGLLAALD